MTPSKPIWMCLSLIFVMACDDPPAPPSPDTPPSASQAAKPTPTRGERSGTQRDKGPQGHILFDRALALEGLTEEQKSSITALQKSVDAPAPDAPEPMAPVYAAFAAGFRAGKIDDAAVTAGIAKMTEQATARRKVFLDTVGKLHAILDPAQRAKLIEGLKARMDAFAPREPQGDGPVPMRPRGGDGAEPDASGGPGKDLKSIRDRRKRFAKTGDLFRVVRDLGLTPEQEKKLRDMRATQKGGPESRDDQRKKLTEMREQMKSIADAFASDTFDVAKFAAMEDASTYRLTLHVTSQVDFAKGLIDVLTKEQLTSLADRLEADDAAPDDAAAPPDASAPPDGAAKPKG